MNKYYGKYSDILEGKLVTIHTRDITKETWGSYKLDLLNLFRDCIEQPNFQKTKIEFVFDDSTRIKLTVEDALINICMWGFIVNCGSYVEPRHVFFEEKGITKKSIKTYIDEFCIIPYRHKIPSYELNNIIYTSLRSLAFVDEFGMFFNNSINIEDFIELANRCPEFDELLHVDYTQYPVEIMNSVAQRNTDRMMELITDSRKYMGRDHCLADAIRAQAGVKPKQLRELIGNIGVKPNGEGGIVNNTIDSSYLRGGLSKIEWMFAESGIGRQAQILSKKNTADSGAFARIVSLNNLDTFLYINPSTGKVDPDYDCCTKNYVKVKIDDLHKLSVFADRYYRFHPNGMEYNIGCGKQINANHPVLGKEIYLRSPITCASAAKGLGICKKCYGELFNTNENINVGKEASDEATERITQGMLSAKHLLEAVIRALQWNIDIEDFLMIEDGILFVNPEIVNDEKWDIVINIDEDIHTETIISLNDESEDSDDSWNEEREYVNRIRLVSETGEEVVIHTQDYDNLCFTEEFARLIKNNKYDNDDEIIVPLEVLVRDEVGMFEIGISNDDMSNKLKNIINVINLKEVTESFNKDEFLENFLAKMAICGLGDIMSVHAEIIIMNQIRDKDDILSKPNWDVPDNPNYQVLTLRRALTCHPSITITLQFDNIAKTLYNPLSFKKKAPSQYDLLYCTQPQKLIHDEVPDRTPRKRMFEVVK